MSITGLYCIDTAAYHADDIELYVYEWRSTPSSATGSKVTRVRNRSHRERRWHRAALPRLQFVRISTVISRRQLWPVHITASSQTSPWHSGVLICNLSPTIPWGSRGTATDLLGVCLPLLDPPSRNVTVRFRALNHLNMSRWFQARSQDFTLGGTEAARVHFFSKKLTTHFCRRPRNLSSPSSGVHIFEIFEAHRTQHFPLLIERTLLLYWTKQAIRPNKASFIP